MAIRISRKKQSGMGNLQTMPSISKSEKNFDQRRHLVHIHKKTELVLTSKTVKRTVSNLLPSERDRLHQLLLNAIIIDGRSFSGLRKSGFPHFLDEIVPGRVNKCKLMTL